MKFKFGVEDTVILKKEVHIVTGIGITQKPGLDGKGKTKHDDTGVVFENTASYLVQPSGSAALPLDVNASIAVGEDQLCTVQEYKKQIDGQSKEADKAKSEKSE